MANKSMGFVPQSNSILSSLLLLSVSVLFAWIRPPSLPQYYAGIIQQPLYYCVTSPHHIVNYYIFYLITPPPLTARKYVHWCGQVWAATGPCWYWASAVPARTLQDSWDLLWYCLYPSLCTPVPVPLCFATNLLILLAWCEVRGCEVRSQLEYSGRSHHTHTYYRQVGTAHDTTTQHY